MGASNLTYIGSLSLSSLDKSLEYLMGLSGVKVLLAVGLPGVRVSLELLALGVGGFDCNGFRVGRILVWKGNACNCDHGEDLSGVDVVLLASDAMEEEESDVELEVP